MVSVACNTNVFGACTLSGLLYFMDDQENMSWIFCQNIAMLVICMLIQFSFVFWVWESIDLNQAAKSCSVHPVANLASVAVLATNSIGTMRSCVLHSRIILCAETVTSKDHEAIIGCSKCRRAVVFVIAVCSELLVLIFYLPLGVIYVLLQESPEETVMASVAMNFILEIDEILFDKFAGQWRTAQIKRNTFQLTKTSRECSSVQQLAIASLKNGVSKDPQLEENAAHILHTLFWRDLVLAITFTFGIVFGVREGLLYCSAAIRTFSQVRNDTGPGELHNSSSTLATPAHNIGNQVPLLIATFPSLSRQMRALTAALRSAPQVLVFYGSLIGISIAAFIYFIVWPMACCAWGSEPASERQVHPGPELASEPQVYPTRGLRPCAPAVLQPHFDSEG